LSLHTSKLFTDLDFAMPFSICCPTLHLHGSKVFCLLVFSCTCYFIHQPKSHLLACEGAISFAGNVRILEDPGFRLEVKSYCRWILGLSRPGGPASSRRACKGKRFMRLQAVGVYSKKRNVGQSQKLASFPLKGVVLSLDVHYNRH